MGALQELFAVFELVLGPPIRAAAHCGFAATLMIVAAGPPRGCSKEKAYAAAMKSDLRELVIAQEAHFEKHSRYATVLPPDEYRHSTGVATVSMDGGATGFVAVVSYPGGTAKRCTIVYRRGDVGIPTCDE